MQAPSPGGHNPPGVFIDGTLQKPPENSGVLSRARSYVEEPDIPAGGEVPAVLGTAALITAGLWFLGVL